MTRWTFLGAALLTVATALGLVVGTRQLRRSPPAMPPTILPAARIARQAQTPLQPDWAAPPLPFALPERATLQQPLEQPTGAVIPHHLLAAELMARTYARLDPTAYQRIILISPDHFAQGFGDVHLASAAVDTTYGLVPKAAVPDALAALPHFTIAQLAREHGLYLHLPFAARYLPGVPVLMVAVRENADPGELAAVAAGLAATSTLTILSSDFSHELPPRWAAFHDGTTIAALMAADPAGISHLETDNRAALRLFLELVKRQGSQRFTRWEHANGDTINPAGRYETVTSYLTGGYFPGAPEPQPGLSLTFTGDVMLDRGVYAESRRAGGLDYPFRAIPRLLTGDDFTVINHEGPMTADPYHAPGARSDSLIFNVDPAYRPFMKAADIEVFGLANNHTLNRGPAGLAETRQLLTEAGGMVVGDPDQLTEPLKLARYGQTATLFAIYDQNDTDYIAVGKRIAQTPANEFSIVLMHWGIEYSPRFSQRQQQIAHGLIDRGADLVIGTGPHVIQPIEVYRGRAIFYSLGNFIFDQDRSAATRQGLLVGVRLNPDDVTLTLLPTTMRNGQAMLAPTGVATTTMEFLAQTLVGEPGGSAGLRNSGVLKLDW